MRSGKRGCVSSAGPRRSRSSRVARVAPDDGVRVADGGAGSARSRSPATSSVSGSPTPTSPRSSSAVAAAEHAGVHRATGRRHDHLVRVHGGRRASRRRSGRRCPTSRRSSRRGSRSRPPPRRRRRRDDLEHAVATPMPRSRSQSSRDALGVERARVVSLDDEVAVPERVPLREPHDQRARSTTGTGAITAATLLHRIVGAGARRCRSYRPADGPVAVLRPREDLLCDRRR